MPRRSRLTLEQITAITTPNVGAEAIAVPCQPAEFLAEFIERGRNAQTAIDEFIADYNKRHPIKPGQTKRSKKTP